MNLAESEWIKSVTTTNSIVDSGWMFIKQIFLFRWNLQPTAAAYLNKKPKASTMRADTRDVGVLEHKELFNASRSWQTCWSTTGGEAKPKTGVRSKKKKQLMEIQKINKNKLSSLICLTKKHPHFLSAWVLWSRPQGAAKKECCLQQLINYVFVFPMFMLYVWYTCTYIYI